MKSAIEQSASLSTQKSRTSDIGSGSVCRMPVALGQGAGSAAALCSPKGHGCSSSEHRDLCHTRTSVYCLNTFKSKNATSDLPSPQFSSTLLVVKALKREAVCAFRALCLEEGTCPCALCSHSVPSASCCWPAAPLATASPSKYLPVESRAGWDFHSSWKMLTSH